jgi:site-specific DNA-methyltransferase (adenine-specific)
VRLFENIDCMEGMKRYPDKYFELAIVDPPYGIEDWNKRGSNKDRNRDFDPEKTKTWDKKPTEDYFNELFRVSNSQIIWGANHFFDYLGSTKAMLVWDKHQDGMHFNQCELAWVHNLNESIVIFRKPSWLERNRIHPTQKPIELYQFILTKYAKPNDKILDTHVGSASSLIACEDMGFDYVGFEIDKDYYEAACKRLEQFRSQFKLAL